MTIGNWLEDRKNDSAKAETEKMNEEYVQVVRKGRGMMLVEPKSVD